MAKFKIGDKVRFIDSEKHKKIPECYPEVGTMGEILEVLDFGNLLIQWPKGSTSCGDFWCCNRKRVELVTEGGGPDGT